MTELNIHQLEIVLKPKPVKNLKLIQS